MSGIEIEVIVVDNASTDGSRNMIAREFPNIQLINNEKNIGFSASNNRGIRHARGKFVLLLNPDTEVLDGALQKTLDFMNSDPGVGVVGCKLLTESGRVQPSVRSFPSIWNLLCESTLLYLLFPKSKLFGRYYMSYFDYNSVYDVDWLCGAFMMIRREVIDAVGMLDERFFMYSEEVDYCYRVKQAGFRVVFYPGANIIHHWGGPRTSNKRLIYWVHKSQLLYVQKYFSGAERLLLESLKYMGILLRVITYGIAGIFLINKRYLEKANCFGFALWSLLGEWRGAGSLRQ